MSSYGEATVTYPSSSVHCHLSIKTFPLTLNNTVTATTAPVGRSREEGVGHGPGGRHLQDGVDGEQRQRRCKNRLSVCLRLCVCVNVNGCVSVSV